jgi:hypothetical protein
MTFPIIGGRIACLSALMTRLAFLMHALALKAMIDYPEQAEF